jgi:hypothetical protein
MNAALDRNRTPSLIPWIRGAAHEATAIAWLHPFPLLVFPGLFEEKLTAVRRHHHQQQIPQPCGNLFQRINQQQMVPCRLLIQHQPCVISEAVLCAVNLLRLQ